jgi:ribulose-phosphate 3-epimerase
LKYLIVPSIIATTQNQLQEMLNKIEGKVERVQLDIMDGKFVPNKSLNFDFELKPGLHYEAHLMIKQPLNWIDKNADKVQTIIMHIETLKNIKSALDQVKKRGVKVGLATTLETKSEKILPYLKFVDQLLFMTVDPGSYCVEKEFRHEPLEKIKKIREINNIISIEVDGCMNPENLKLSKEAGANIFVSGSYILKSDNIDKAIKELKKAI